MLSQISMKLSLLIWLMKLLEHYPTTTSFGINFKNGVRTHKE